MPNAFVEATTSLDVSRDQCADLVFKINDEAKFDVHVGNSLIALALALKSTCQESTK
jgi:hypothetical protein